MEINFLNYVKSLGLQATIFLGETPSPITQKLEKNFKQAKLLIDTLAMLREKTVGNLAEDEAKALSRTLSALQTRYQELTSDEGRG